MPRFNELSLKRLNECHPELNILFTVVVKQIDCTIIEGYRDKAAQDAAFKSGDSKLEWPNGKHNRLPCLAVDVSPYPVFWENLNRFFWFSGYVLGVADQLYDRGHIKHKVRWGGDWNHNYDITDEKGLRDLVHFELIMA